MIGEEIRDYRVPDFHQLTPKTEIQSRIDRAQKILVKQGLDALLIVYPIDLFYFSWTMQDGYLLIPFHGNPTLFVRKDLSRARAESSIDEVIGLDSFRNLGVMVNERLGNEPRRLGIELDVLPVSWFRRYESFWPSAEFVDAGPMIMDLRSIKSDFEVRFMRQAGDLAREVYAQVSHLLRPGLTEIELAGLITKEAYAGGHQNYMRARKFNQELYTWHVISGESGGIVSAIDAPFGGYGLSPAFPVGGSHKVIRRGESVLIDFGLCSSGYQVDLTRMFSIGIPSPLIEDSYYALTSIEAELVENLRPGVLCSSLYEMAIDKADQLGFRDVFLGPKGLKSRFVGHGIGLEMGEPPFLAPGFDAPLSDRMTVALELKMVFQGLGAVGLENTLFVQKSGPEKLTTASEAFTIV
jgi:Xaa-Pro aminopeptidase